MRSKNSKPIDDLESAWLADVKSCACVICGAKAPTEAHHVVQGDHFTTCALCDDCHTGPYGWHGDKSRWGAAKMTVYDAINATVRAVTLLRAGITTLGVTRARTAAKEPKGSTYVRSKKICARKGFA